MLYHSGVSVVACFLLLLLCFLCVVASLSRTLSVSWCLSVDSPLIETKTRDNANTRVIQHGQYHKIVRVVLILLYFKQVTNKNLWHRKWRNFSLFLSVLFYFIIYVVMWQVNVANAVISDVATRWKTTINTEIPWRWPLVRPKCVEIE